MRSERAERSYLATKLVGAKFARTKRKTAMEQPGREMISLDEALNRVLGTLDVGGREQVLVDLDQSL